MLAGRFTARHRIELVEVPEPVLAPLPPEGDSGQVLFEPHLTCLCGSDLPYFNGEAPEFPGVVGHSLHEMIGRVVATNGTRFRAGDKVLAVPVNQQGLFERYVLSESRAVPVDPRLPDEAAVLAQPLGTVIFALKKLPVILDRDVAIIGQGPIGQMMVACFRNLGVREIIVLDKLDSRLALSKRMGATAIINVTRDDPVASVREVLRGDLPDIVVEAVGHADQQLNLAIALCKRFANLLYFGVPSTTVNEIALREMFIRNVQLHTSVNPDFNRDFPLAMKWLAERRLDLSPLVTHHFPLSEIQEAFEVFRDRRDGAQKVFVEFPAYRV